MRDPKFDPDTFDLGDPLAMLDLPHEEATLALGEALATSLVAGDFLGLVGTLGAGKTTLVRGLTRRAAPASLATSPTYTLVNLYEGDPTIIHMDLYRLANFDDLESIGYWEYVEEYDGVCCVEWFSTIPDSFPRRGVVILLDAHEGGRRATVWAVGDGERQRAQAAIKTFQATR